MDIPWPIIDEWTKIGIGKIELAGRSMGNKIKAC
jgi:hypothetical protein